MARTTDFKGAARAFKRLGRMMEDEVDDLVLGIGHEVMTDVKASRAGKGVPVDTGTLRSTGRVESLRRGLTALSFGGPAAPYALKQHEDTTLNHDIGEARFLIRGLDRWTPDGSAAIKALQRNAAEAVAKAGGV